MLLFNQNHFKQYLRFYVFWLLSVIILAAAAQLLINNALKENNQAYTLGLLRGTELLIEEKLAQAPPEQWPSIVQELDKKFSYQLSLRAFSDKAATLSAQQMSQLQQGQSVITNEGDTMYRLLGDGLTLAVIGPLSQSVNPEYAKAFRHEMVVKFTIYGIAALLFAGLAWWWFRPLQLDARNLRATAKNLGDGKLSARSEPAQSQLFSPLIETLNGMAERIELLLAAHKDMSNMISHELRTPLARIRFSLGIVQELDDPDEMARYFQQIEDNLTELDALVEAALVFGRFERQEVNFRPAPHALQTWLRQQLGELDILAGDVQLRLQSFDGADQVEFDRTLLTYAVRNLIRNALKYTRTQVAVAIELSDDRVCLHVDDDGLGVPLSERSAILLPFTRFNRDHARSNAGFGLGLNIAVRIMALHQGQVIIADSPLGGARFTLSWPLRLD